MSITLAQICDAVETTLGAATTLARSESYDELTEGIQDLPMLQVYPDSAFQDPAGETERTSFGAQVRQTEITIVADYFARQRSHIGEDMAALVNGIDALTNILEGQNEKPYFALEGLKAFRWSWERVTFTYSQVDYVGARFTLVFRVF